MNTSFFEYGVYVNDRDKIMKKYVKTMLFCDILSMIVLIVSEVELKTFNNFKILFVFAYFNIRHIYQNLKIQRITNDFFEIFLLLFRLICISHFIACIWHAIAYYEFIYFPHRWLDDYEFNEWYYKYITSLYWAITTLCTVGYGDITPQNFLKNGLLFMCYVNGNLDFRL